MRRPRLKRTRESVLTAAGDIYILRPGEDADLVIEQPDAATRDLLAALDGCRSAAELEREFGAERVADALGQMSALGLLEDAVDDERVTPRDAARYDRQLRYFSDVSSGPLPPSRYQRRLREAGVLILGLGGLGSWPRMRSHAVGSASSCCSTGTGWRRATSTARSSTASATSAGRRRRRPRRRSPSSTRAAG